MTAAEGVFIVLGRINALNYLILRFVHFFYIGPDYLLETQSMVSTMSD